MFHRARILALLALLLAAFAPIAAEARSPYAGRYRVAEGPDTAGALDLRADGTFRYFLIEGALDEAAAGSWTETGGDIRLTTDPKPVAPVFARAADEPAAPTALRVRLADGRDLAGIDFRLGLVGGGIMAGYTQAEGWSFADPSGKAIAWVELHEPIHGIVSQRFAIDPPAAGGLVFALTPNDIGVIDFGNAWLERRSDDFVLHHPRRELRIVREREPKP